jgi:signal transduction histidine kinase
VSRGHEGGPKRMPTVHQDRQNWVRLGLLLVTLACVGLQSGLPAAKVQLNLALGAMVVVLVASLLLANRPCQAPLHLSLLALDLLAVGGIGCVLVAGSSNSTDPRLLFVSGYVVAVLVSLVGARMSAALLGGLAGVMVLLVGTGLGLHPETVLDPQLFVVQAVLILAFSLHTAHVAGAVRREARASELARHVGRELKTRETEAAELVSFTQSLADSGSIGEIAEAALRYLRCHTGLQCRSVVIESEGEEAALWEEPGQLDADQIEDRRGRIQEALRRAGSNFIVRKLKCRATTIHPAPAKTAFRTLVDIPVRVGGRVAGVLLTADPAPGAVPPERIGILVDVARRTSEAIRRLERQRGHEHRRTALLLRQMREGVLLLSADGQVQLANPMARRVIAASRDEDGDPDAPQRIGDFRLDELCHTPPGVSRRFRATVAEAGQETPMQLACTAISVLDRSQRIGTLITIADVTEEELARGRIVQAERTTLVGQTLAGVAHELNNPLAALIGYADLLDGMEMPEAIEKPVAQMREQALRATRIVRNLLNFARRRNPERVPISARDLVQETLELFTYEARMHGIEIRTELADDLPPVLSDKHALQQVIVNLIQNAIHALQNWTGERTLSVKSASTKDGVVISVSDSGPGVPEDLRRRVFESFFTTKGPSKGTGLGLPLSRSIAQEHGGDLILAPDTGRGASFSLRLPQADAASGAALRLLGPDEAAELVVPQKILVVDDEASVRETLVAQLGLLGSRVDSAANVHEAQRLLRTSSYDALLVDIRMPGGTGLDLHAELQEKNPLLADRVIFITGDFVNDELTSRALDTGRLLLEKPFTMKELTRALGKLAA